MKPLKTEEVVLNIIEDSKKAWKEFKKDLKPGVLKYNKKYQQGFGDALKWIGEYIKKVYEKK